jgi:hypothetical protein
MPRCSPSRHQAAGGLLAATLALCLGLAPFAAQAQSADATAQVTTQSTTVDASAPQTVRDFPPHALRGTLQVGMAPVAAINGQDARLAPGARIRGADNMLILPGMISGQKLLVHYTVDNYQLIKDVWVLRAEEAAMPWPQTLEEAATWTYNPVARTWSKPQ